MALHYVKHPSLNRNRWTLVHKVGDALIDGTDYSTIPLSFEELVVYAPHIPINPEGEGSYFWKRVLGEDGEERILYRVLCVLYNEEEDRVRCTMMRVRDGYITNPSAVQLQNFSLASDDEVDDFILNNDILWCTQSVEVRKRNAQASVNRTERELSIYSATLSLVNRLATLTQPEQEEEESVPTTAPSRPVEGGSVTSNFTGDLEQSGLFTGGTMMSSSPEQQQLVSGDDSEVDW